MHLSSLTNLSVRKIVSANKIQTAKNATLTKKNRAFWGISIKLSGETRYICDKKEIISNEHFIVLLPKGSSYHMKSTGGECLLLDFDSDDIANEPIAFYIKNNFNLVELFNKIQATLILKPDYYELQLKQLLYKFLVLLFNENKKYIPSQQAEKIAPAVEYIVQHYNDSNITIDFLSSLASMSYTYFRKIFTEEFGCPPMEYLNVLRMQKAAEILKSDYTSIQEIAFSVGYNSLYHFSKMFKKYFGVSPSKFATKQ